MIYLLSDDLNPSYGRLAKPTFSSDGIPIIYFIVFAIIFIAVIGFIAFRVWLSFKNDEKVEKERVEINKKYHIDF